MHKMSLILQQEEDHQSKILGSDSKVGIYTMVDGLNITRSTKRKLREILQKFKILFEGVLERVKIELVDLQLENFAKSCTTTYYNVPEAYEQPLRKEVDYINFLEKLKYTDDSSWAAM